MIVNIHYDPATGNIEQMDSGHAATPRNDHLALLVVEVDEWPGKFANGPGRFRVDHEYGALVEITDPGPSEAEIGQAIFSELGATDHFFLSDRKLPKSVTDAWKQYRATLRGLSKLPASQRLAAWPTRPDGADPIHHLRSRI